MDTEFWEDYDLRVNQIQRSGWKLFGDRLIQWLDVIEGDATAASVLNEIENSGPFDEWLAQMRAAPSGMIGSAKLEWPAGKMQRLGAQVFLIRKWSHSWSDALNFAVRFFGKSQFDEVVDVLQRQIFLPMVEEFTLYLRRRERSEREFQQFPASDRTVSLDHNQLEAKHAIAAIDLVSDAIVGLNDFDDDSRSQRLAELSAGKKLLEATRVRLDAVRTVLVQGLKWIADKFAAGMIGALAKAALTALAAWIGLTL